MELVHVLAGRCKTTSWDEAGVWRTCFMYIMGKQILYRLYRWDGGFQVVGLDSSNKGYRRYFNLGDVMLERDIRDTVQYKSRETWDQVSLV